MNLSRNLRRLGGASMWASGLVWNTAAWAQSASSCQISLAYTPVPAAVAVPSLTLFGVGVLGSALAVVAWRSRSKHGVNRLLAVALAVGAVFFSVAGADSVVSSVRAAAPYEFSNPAGGAVTDNTIVFASPSPLVTVTNTSGVRVRINTNGNASDTGTCTVGSELAPGATCTTQAACPVPVAVAAAPITACNYDALISTYVRDSMGGSFYVYAPKMEQAPSFNPGIAGISTNFTYVRGVTVPQHDANGELTNGEALGSGTATVTSTAPSGYFFPDTGSSTKTWSFPYICWNQDGGIT